MNGAISVQDVIRQLDRRTSSEVGTNHIALNKQYGLDSLIEPYIEAFPKIRNSAGRIEILFWVTRYAKENPLVVELARFALGDRSRVVRNYACGALAYALNHESIVFLQELLDHPEAMTQDDARAAICAIENDNHHLFADREGKGNIFWEPGKVD